MRSRTLGIHGAMVAVVALGCSVAIRARQTGSTSSQQPTIPCETHNTDDAAPGSSSSSADPAKVPAKPICAVATPNTPNAASAKVAQIQVPAGTHIPLVLHNAISTRSARPGDPVYFETLFPVIIEGRVVIPAGSYVSGEVTQSKRPGRVKGRGELAIKLTTMILPNAYIVKLDAAPGGSVGTGGNESINGEGTIKGDSDKGSDAGTVVRSTAEGAGIGAGVGAAAGHIGEGAGIGVGAGAAAGLAEVLLSRGPETELPRGTTLDAVLDRPVYLDSDKVKFTGPGQASSIAGPPNREPQRQRIPF
jgi:hypothetical protein